MKKHHPKDKKQSERNDKDGVRRRKLKPVKREKYNLQYRDEEE